MYLVEEPQVTKKCHKIFKRITVRDNEAVCVWSGSGNCSIFEGPRRKFITYGRAYQRLNRFYAADREYLKVVFHDGHIEHLEGPTSMFLRPHEHRSIAVEEAWAIDASHVLVVYRKEAESDEVTRRLVRGPALFVPKPNEFLHTFKWHGTDPNDKTRKIPGALQFHRLRVGPVNALYYNVKDVRTKDDALVTVKVMIFYQLVDVERMLDSTTDVIGDLIADVCADCVSFAAKLTYEEFLECTDRLSSLETYAQLGQRAESMGYALKKVVFRGYHVSADLQAMHDAAIEKRTAMHLETEAARQEQDLLNLKLEMDQARLVQEQKLEIKRTEHAAARESMAAEATRARDTARLKLELQSKKDTAAADAEAERVRVDQRLAYLAQVRDLGADVGAILVAEARRADKVIAVDGAEGVRVHVHGADE